MSSEFAPKGSNPRMTQAQVRKYIKDMRSAQAKAKKQLPDEEEEAAERHAELGELGEKLNDVF